MSGLLHRILRRLLPADDREVFESELAELHELRAARSGSESANRRLRRERISALWHFALLRTRMASGSRNPGAPHGHRQSTPEHTMLADLVTDLGHAGRALRRRPGFVAVAALTLGVGVGAAGAVFAMVNQLLLRPVSGITDPDAGFLALTAPDGRRPGVSGPVAEEIRRSATLLEGVATFDYIGLTVTAGDARPIETRGYTVYGDYFELLGVPTAEGRLLAASETGPDADPFVAVISERLSDQLFGASASAVGQQFEVGEHTMTVIGVAGGGFTGTDRFWPIDVWVPRSAFVPLAGFPRERLWSPESTLNQDFVAKPRSGVSLRAAEAQLDGILDGLAESDAPNGAYLKDLRASLHTGFIPPDMKRFMIGMLAVLAVPVGLILLLACANVANLLLVRGIHRRGEAAVCLSLGASASRIVRVRLLESVILAAAGTLAGLAVAWLIMLLFRGASLLGLPGFEGFSLDVRVLAFAAAAVLLCTVLAGALPAVFAGRGDLTSALRDAATHASTRHGLARNASSAFQVALSLTLLVGSLLLARTLRNVYAVDPGLDLAGLAAVPLDFEAAGAQSEPGMEAPQRAVLDAAKRVPGVTGAAYHGWYGLYSGQQRARVSLPETPDEEAVRALTYWVSPEWFGLLGVKPVSGRTFTASDWAAAPLNVVITAPLARRLFGRANPVGRSVKVGNRVRSDAEVVGVIGEVRMADLRLPPDEAVFVSYNHGNLGSTRPVTLLFRAESLDPGTLEAVARALEAALPTVPVPRPAAVTDRIDVQLSEQRILARLLALVSSLAVLLAAVGLYGAIAFTVASRRVDFGIRIALGADGRRITWLVLRSAAAVVGAGTTLGLMGAYGLSRVIESRLFGVAALDPRTYLGAAILLGLVAAAACALPARAAVLTDPVRSLRRE